MFLKTFLKKNNIHKRNSEEIPFLESVRRDEQKIIEFFKIHPVLIPLLWMVYRT